VIDVRSTATAGKTERPLLATRSEVTAPNPDGADFRMYSSRVARGQAMSPRRRDNQPIGGVAAKAMGKALQSYTLQVGSAQRPRNRVTYICISPSRAFDRLLESSLN
jgi:hypothetical protein